MTSADVPRYVAKLNKIIKMIDEQPDHIWAKRQRDIAEELGTSQAEVSNLIKLLKDNGKIKDGESLPFKGKSNALVLLDGTPFTTRPPIQVMSMTKSDDRPLTIEETVTSTVNLNDVSIEQIGRAVVGLLQRLTTAEASHLRNRHILTKNIQTLKTNLDTSHLTIERLENKVEELNVEIQEQEMRLKELRGELNKALSHKSYQSAN